VSIGQYCVDKFISANNNKKENEMLDIICVITNHCLILLQIQLITRRIEMPLKSRRKISKERPKIDRRVERNCLMVEI
jgi:hypothetical protein